MATILLADDDAAVRDLVRRALSADGHTVHVTQDGTEALDCLGANLSSIQVLVTDVDMPQLDGISLVEKALALNPAIAVVLMSGFSDQLDRAGRLRVRKLLSVSKPFTLDQIKNVVRSALS
jgi:DNA-binding NtrC family response regulator